MNVGVADGARTHDNRNHNHKIVEKYLDLPKLLQVDTG